MSTTEPKDGGLAVALTSLFIAFAVSSFVWTLVRHDKYPIVGRDWRLLTCGWASQALLGAYLFAYVGFQPPCGVMFAFEVLPIVMGTNCYVARVFRLWFRLARAELQQSQRRDLRRHMAMAHTKSEEVSSVSSSMSNALTDKRSWFVTHAHYGTTQFIFNVFFVVTAIESVILAIVFGVGLNTGHDFDVWPRQGCPGLDSAIFISLIPMGIGGGVLTYTAYKLRNIRDGFWIKHELFYTCLIAPFACVLYACHERLNTGTDFRAISLLFGTFNGIIMIPMNIVPIYLSYQDRAVSRSPSGSRNEFVEMNCKAIRSQSLSDYDAKLAHDITVVRSFKLKNDTTVQQVIRNPEFERERDALEEQMKTEFSIEAFFFMEDYFRFIDEYDELTDEEVCSTVIDIYNRFIRYGCDEETNIDHVTRTKLAETINSLIPSAGVPLKHTGGSVTFSGKRVRADSVIDLADVAHKARFPRDVYDGVYADVSGALAGDIYRRWLMKEFSAYDDAKKRIKASSGGSSLRKHPGLASA